MYWIRHPFDKNWHLPPQYAMRIEQIIFSFFFDLVALRYDENVDVNRTFCLFQRCENEKWHEYLSSDNALLAMLGQPH